MNADRIQDKIYVLLRKLRAESKDFPLLMFRRNRKKQNLIL